jgi:bifunctional DNase/RNase
MSELKLTVLRVEPQSASLYLLILVDEERQVLPMTIGPCEAMSIQMMLPSQYVGPRLAMTHDLLQDMIGRLGGRVAKVVIDDLWNKVYFAKIHIAVDGESIAVDSRPSDAVAVALRAEAPLYATDAVMRAAAEPEPPEESEGPSPDGDLDLGEF